MKYIVVGGGPSGMATAISLSKNHEVILIERNESLGKKLLMTGNGRCNILNNKNNQELIKHIHHGKFLYSALDEVNVSYLINFFEQSNVLLKEEDNGRMFPVSNKSKDILGALTSHLNGVKIHLNTQVTDLIIEDNTIKGVMTSQGEMLADGVVMATGGLSYPMSGSDGVGHSILNNHKISITDCYPVETSLISHEAFIQDKILQGLTLNNIILNLKNDKNKLIYQTNGNLLFTHYGVSGPAVLKASEHVYHLLKKQPKVSLHCQLINNETRESLFEKMKNYPHRVDKFLMDYLPKRMIVYLLDELKLKDIPVLSHKEIKKLIEHLFNFKIEIMDVMDIKKATVTGGGVSLKEVNPYNFESKRYRNLYMVGELLDCHGEIGGYNLTLSLVSGFVCGQRVSLL